MRREVFIRLLGASIVALLAALATRQLSHPREVAAAGNHAAVILGCVDSHPPNPIGGMQWVPDARHFTATPGVNLPSGNCAEVLANFEDQGFVIKSSFGWGGQYVGFQLSK